MLVHTVAFLLHGAYSNQGTGEGVNCGIHGVESTTSIDAREDEGRARRVQQLHRPNIAASARQIADPLALQVVVEAAAQKIDRTGSRSARGIVSAMMLDGSHRPVARTPAITEANLAVGDASGATRDRRLQEEVGQFVLESESDTDWTALMWLRPTRGERQLFMTMRVALAKKTTAVARCTRRVWGYPEGREQECTCRELSVRMGREHLSVHLIVGVADMTVGLSSS